MTQPPFFERDDLEQRLHSELHDYAPEAPNQLWAGIEARLPQGRRRRPILWWCLMVVIAGLLAGTLYRFNGEKPLVQGAPTQVKKLAVMRPIARTTTKNLAVGSSALPITQVVTPALELTKHRTMPGTEAGIIGIASDAGILSAKTSFENFHSLPSQTSDSDPSLSIERLTPIPSFSPLGHDPKYDSTFLVQTPRIQPFRDQRWEIGPVTGPVWLWQKAVTNAPGHTNHLAFAEQSDGPATGWQAGLSARFNLRPRWRLNTSLLRRTTTQVSTHTAELRLMDGVCLNPYDPGPKVYEFQYALHSSGSESNLTVLIAQEDTATTMPSDEAFLLTMRTSRQRTDWVLPLTLHRSFGRGGWQGFVEGGGALTVPGSINVQVEHFSEACADLCFEANHMPTVTSQERADVTISWVFGAGVDYRLSRHLSLSASPTLFGQQGKTGLLFNTGMYLRF